MLARLVPCGSGGGGGGGLAGSFLSSEELSESADSLTSLAGLLPCKMEFFKSEMKYKNMGVFADASLKACSHEIQLVRISEWTTEKNLYFELVHCRISSWLGLM